MATPPALAGLQMTFTDDIYKDRSTVKVSSVSRSNYNMKNCKRKNNNINRSDPFLYVPYVYVIYVCMSVLHCFHHVQYPMHVLLMYPNTVFVLPDGLWCSDKPKVLKLGVLPVKAMLAVEEHLWASSGGQVFIISTHTHSVEVWSLAQPEAVITLL